VPLACWVGSLELLFFFSSNFEYQYTSLSTFFYWQSIANLAKAFENGFDNYSTVRGDPDLDPIKQQSDFIKLMDSYETKGFNPFGFFGKK
jgi:hypothetical protein